MATARPPGGGSSATPTARIGIDLSALRAAAGVAREAGQATAREISQAFRTVQSEQRLVLEQARQATVALRTQQAQISASARAESSERMALARSEAAVRSQQARATAAASIEAERRATAQYRSELREREAAARSAAATSSTAGAFGRSAATFAGAALGGFGGPVGALAGGLLSGAPAAAAGLAVAQGARLAVQADQLATSYNRQRVAAENLAGSQARLNSLLAAYDRASGGAVDQSQALADVTRLMSVGFADNAQELDQFARAIRGISIAMGTSQDTVTQNLILELFSQRGQRLDQLGLQYDKVRQRADELRAADASLTQQMAYQQAVLEQANERFGVLTTSTAGQATEVERLTRAWKDLRLEMAQDIKEPTEDVAGGLAGALEWFSRFREANRRRNEEIIWERQAADWMRSGRTPPPIQMGPQMRPPTPSTRADASASRWTDEQSALIRDWAEARQEIERGANQARLDATQAYEQQRTSTIRQYEQTIAREAEDFARQRARAEQQLIDDIADIRADAARRETKQAEELARDIARARADSAERVAEWEEDHAERVADLRADSNERLAELEEDYQRDRERAAESHRESLLDAASRLDAAAVAAEQRRYAQEQREAEEQHQERIDDERESLEERIAQEREAHEERLADEAEALDKRIRQEQEAHAERLAEAREADEQRIADMREDFEERKRIEDEDRAIRLARMAQDHNDQLGEMDRQHGLRLAQIREQAAEEREQLDAEFKRQMVELEAQIDAWIDEQNRLTDAAIESYNRWFRNLELRAAGLRGLSDREGSHPSAADPYIDLPLPATATTSSRSTTSNTVTIEAGAIVVQEATRPGQTAQEVEDALINILGRLH